MDPVGAALIGAAVGASTSIAAQFISHGLGVRRDRRNQYRQRLYDVIVEAATALYEPRRPPPELASSPPLHPAVRRFTDDPKRVAFVEAWSDGLTLLLIHFGHGHQIVDDYIEAHHTVVRGIEAMAPDRANDDEAIAQLPVKLRAAQIARDDWMTKARAYVDRV